MDSWMCIETLEVIRKCSCCGKSFQRTPQWGWWYKQKIVCSYHCMKAMERADPASYENIKRAEEQGLPPPKKTTPTHRAPAKPRDYQFQSLPPDKVDAIKVLYKNGMTPFAIAKRMRVAHSTVYKYIKGVEKDVHADNEST